MTQADESIKPFDPIWDQMRREAEEIITHEPVMGGMIHAGILHHDSFEAALSYRIAQKLASADMPEQMLRELTDAVFAKPECSGAARADLSAVLERDPACQTLVQPMMYFKGFQALQAHRVAHCLWDRGVKHQAYFIQSRISETYGVDIHPGAKLGKGIMIDHAHAIVIGETAVVGDNVSLLHGVTLGGTGKDQDDRHPKIGDGVLIGAGAKVLGNIKIGHCTRIAAGSVVLSDVPPCKTVAGVPAKIVGEAGCDQPSVEMDQTLTKRM